MLTYGVVIVKVEEAGTFNFPEFCYLMDRAVREDAEVGSVGSGVEGFGREVQEVQGVIRCLFRWDTGRHSGCSARMWRGAFLQRKSGDRQQ